MVDDGTGRDYELPPVAPASNEGKTVAGWVMFWGVCLGGLVTGLGVMLWLLWLVVVGVAVLGVGLVASKVLSVMGMGQPRDGKSQPGAGEANWYS